MGAHSCIARATCLPDIVRSTDSVHFMSPSACIHLSTALWRDGQVCPVRVGVPLLHMRSRSSGVVNVPKGYGELNPGLLQITLTLCRYQAPVLHVSYLQRLVCHCPHHLHHTALHKQGTLHSINHTLHSINHRCADVDGVRPYSACLQPNTVRPHRHQHTVRFQGTL